VGQTLGAADYLTKPIDPDRLVATLMRHTRARTDAIVAPR